jgi:hypothetical protein
MMMFKDVQDFMPGEISSSKHYRAIFISDLHLGTPGCQAEALLEFLKTHPVTLFTWLVTSLTVGNLGANGIGLKHTMT